MALKLATTITQANDCSYITIYDTTGDYDAVSNPTGWGAPNPVKADVTAARIELTSDTYTTALTVNLSLDPLSDLYWQKVFNTTGLELEATEFFGSSITTYGDGWYTFTYILTIAAVEYEYANYKAFICTLMCQLRNKALSLSIPVTNFTQSQEIFTAFFMFQCLEWAACNDMIDRFNKIKYYLESLLGGCGVSGITNYTSQNNTGCCGS